MLQQPSSPKVLAASVGTAEERAAHWRAVRQIAVQGILVPLVRRYSSAILLRLDLGYRDTIS